MRLIERDAELRLIEEFRRTCRDGRGVAVVLDGPVGSGKTALLQELADTARSRRDRFFAVTGAASEQAHPFALMKQLVEAMCAAGMRDPFTAEESDVRDRPAQTFRDADFGLLQRVCQTICSFAEEAPLLIGIDDVHFADDQSLRCLGHLARRLEPSRVVMVMSESTGYERELAALHAEILPLTNCHRITLGPLTAAGIGELLGDGGAGITRRPDLLRELADRYLDITGGSPLLVKALLEDSTAVGDPRPGASFRVAVLRCLRRCAPEMLSVLRAAALLGAAQAELVGEFLGVDDASVHQRVPDLNDLGILRDQRFRHEQARLAVLGDIPRDRLPRLHVRAAELLHDSGAPAATVADHLVAAQHVAKISWAVPILRQAADEAIVAGEIARGVNYLRRAAGCCADPVQKAQLTAALSEALWELDPNKANRYLASLGRDVRAGSLTGRDAMVPVRQAIWQGRGRAAKELLAAADGDARDPSWQLAPRLTVTRLWFSFCFPELAGQPGSPPGAGSPWANPTAALNVLRSAVGLAGEKAPGQPAGQFLRGTRTGGSVVDILLASLMLIQLGRLPEAVRAVEEVLGAEAARVPMRHAILEIAKSMAARHRGATEEAREHAENALGAVALGAWGIVAGLPLSLAIRTATEVGDLDAVPAYLDTPVPSAMFETPFVLPYLQAIGHYHLAMDFPQTALRHFQSCRDLMVRWRLDTPNLVDWPADAAAALIALGRTRSARVLLEGHLKHLRGEQAHNRGIALRLLAETAKLRERPALLAEAARLLDADGDRREAARTRGKLAALEEVLTPAAGHPGPPSPRGDAALAELTEAERRVASLAAAGWTNRQIAQSLFVTISTVEQHLTKIYRKLNVRRRSALPLRLIQNG